jgi:Mn2+/Fe2+ NRAMP family transporter
MPTGIDVSVWHSFWTLEKFKLLGIDAADPARVRERLGLQLSDMRLGYGLSLLTALMFMCMGASLLAGQGESLRGAEFASALAGAYAGTLGHWMGQVFMLTAFFAMFSTSYTVVDGFSRSFSEALALLYPALAESRRRLYFGFALSSTALAVILIFAVGNPVVLVTTVALLSLAAAPLLYGLNIYCVRKDISDPGLRPPRWLVILGCAGVGFMVLAVAATAASLLSSKA